jgi:hypothetical protein
MKAITYIFALVLGLTVSTSFATDKVTNNTTCDKKPATTTVLVTEIATLIEEVATSEADRNLVLDSLEIGNSFIFNLIEEDAQDELNAVLDITEIIELSTLENLSETNANQEVNATLHTSFVGIHSLEHLIDNNANQSTNAKLK